jgi:hypothetical protein
MNWKYLCFVLMLMLPHIVTAQTSDTDTVYSSLQSSDADTDSASTGIVTAPAVEDDEEDGPAEPHYIWDQAIPENSDSLNGYTNASLVLRRVPATTMEGFKNDKDLNYERKPRKPIDLGWLNVLLIGLVVLIQRAWIIIIVIAAAVIGWLIYVLLKRNGYVFSRKTAQPGEVDFKEVEEMGAVAYDKQIKAAIAEKKFRLAVRLLYLQSLRLLADNQRIVFNINKTNAAYLRELSPTPLYKPFARLTLDYEYIWYGEMQVDDQQFDNIHRQFSQFMNELGYTR